jgi:hypothetical protein
MNGDWGNVEFGDDRYQWFRGLSFVINDISPTPRQGF